jgi:predicted GNAT family acetyltransferase
VARVTEANVHLAANTFTWLLEEYKEYQPCVAVIEDDQFVSICHSPYISPKAHIAGVDTLEGYRRRGYATAVASEWGVAVRELGQIPIYSTGLDNVASQGVAGKVGLVHYNSDHHFR